MMSLMKVETGEMMTMTTEIDQSPVIAALMFLEERLCIQWRLVDIHCRLCTMCDVIETLFILQDSV